MCSLRGYYPAYWFYLEILIECGKLLENNISHYPLKKESRKFVVRFWLHWKPPEGIQFHWRGLINRFLQFKTLRRVIYIPLDGFRIIQNYKPSGWISESLQWNYKLPVRISESLYWNYKPPGRISESLQSNYIPSGWISESLQWIYKPPGKIPPVKYSWEILRNFWG